MANREWQRKGNLVRGASRTRHMSYVICRMRSRGVSLLEVVIAITIFFILAAGVLLILSEFRSKTDLDRASVATVSLLRLAREQTISAEQNDQWGVHVAAGTVSLFRGSSYIGTDDDFYQLPSGLTASAALAGGGSDVIFDRLDGETATNGTITLTDAQGTTRLLTVFVSGETAISSGLPAELGTRVTDTRHIHLVLPFSFNNSTTMTLTFLNPPNPSTVQAIGIPANTSNGQFSWDGTVNVNGSNEHLVFITHAIGVSTTNLSVRRDRMENTKALVLDVDGVIIATYDAGGLVTGGVGVTVEIQ